MNNTDTQIHEVLIIGSGPAGLTAAIYAARANLAPIVLAGEQFGGQLMNTTEIENFPGFPESIDGPDLMMNMIKQAERFGAIIKYENADKVDLEGEIKTVTTRGGDYKAKAVILATGAVPRLLSVPGEDTFYGKGVSTCATCDGAFYKQLTVAVIGGGDSAMEEALFLTRFAKKVYVVHRRDEFRASKIMADRVMEHPQIEILWNSELKEVQGDKVVEGIKVFNNKENAEVEIPVDGVFIAIGHIPVTGFMNGVALTETGYVMSVDGVHTNVEGVFVAGDVEDQKYRQAITAAGSGCRAALEAQWWLDR